MTWSFTPGGAAKDLLRTYIGDVIATDPQFSDEELAVFIAGRAEGDTLNAAADACRALAARYSRQVNKSLGQASISAGDRAGAYLAIADDLTTRAAAQDAPTMWVGSCSPPAFRRGQDDYPGTGEAAYCDGWGDDDD